MNAPIKTGWPEPELCQDDHRGLFKWFASKPDARQRVREALPTCCEYHADKLPDGCNEGRNCPERTRKAQEDDARWNLRLTEKDGGYEAALPVPLLDNDESEMLDTAEAIFAAAIGLASVAILVGLLFWLIYTIAPLVAALS